MPFADRIAQLGTETAFAVAEDARALAARGRPVFPFHLGDLNIPTPPNIAEAACKAIRDGKTGYAPAAGLPELRDAIAEDVSADRGVRFSGEHVSVQPGGKPVIGKFLMALMNPGDEVLYPNPGYPIYESQIQFLGGVAKPYGYDATPKGFRLRRDDILASMTPRTRFLIYNNAQNPLGAESDEEEMAWVADELLTIADPRLVKLVMRGEDVIGFLFTYHDVSEGLQKAKGQLWPLGWLHLLMARRRTKWANVNGLGIIPEYQGLGANTVLYTELAKTIKAFGFEHIETVLIGEENYRSFSDNEALGVTWYKRHRLYKRRL